MIPRRRFLGNLTAGLTALGMGTKIRADDIIAPVDGAANQALTRGYVEKFIKTPKARYIPKNTIEAQAALQQVLKNRAEFVIQSSGHCFAGLSQSADTIIDLRGFKGIRVDRQNGIIHAGPGVTISDVNRVLSPLNKITPVGTCPTVALGGLVTGGGYGSTMRQLGLACDNLMSAEIITAKGEVLEVNADSHADLYWALRGGGGSSFGLVTRLSLKLHDAPDPRAVLFPIQGTEQAMIDWMLGMTDVIKSAPANMDIYVRSLPVAGQNSLKSFEVQLTNIDDEAGMRKISKQIFDLGLSAGEPSLHQGSLTAMTDALFTKPYPTVKYAIRHSYLSGPLDHAAWKSFLKEVFSHSDRFAGFNLRALGGVSAEPLSGDTAFAHRDAFGLLQYYAWEDTPEDADAVTGILDRMERAVARATQPGQFLNYADRRLENYGQDYWAGNYPRLQNVKAQYDPQNIFNHPQSVQLPS